MAVAREEEGKHTGLYGDIVGGKSLIESHVHRGVILRLREIVALGISHNLPIGDGNMDIDIHVMCLQLSLFLGLGSPLADVDEEFILDEHNLARFQGGEIGLLNEVKRLSEERIQCLIAT
jgi:hypothetical protein